MDPLDRYTAELAFLAKAVSCPEFRRKLGVHCEDFGECA
jgi:hypothetical protein